MMCYYIEHINLRGNVMSDKFTLDPTALKALPEHMHDDIGVQRLLRVFHIIINKMVRGNYDHHSELYDEARELIDEAQPVIAPVDGEQH